MMHHSLPLARSSNNVQYATWIDWKKQSPTQQIQRELPTVFYCCSFPSKLSFRAFLSCLFTINDANLDRSGAGKRLAATDALPAPQLLSVTTTSRKRTLPPSPAVAPAPSPPFTAEEGSSTSLAMGAHSLARLQGMPSLDDSPLMSMEDRPTRTRSWGNDWSSLTGEFGLSSPLSYPPGNVSTDASNSHMATAAAASSLASSFNSTPSSRARSPMVARSSGSSSPTRSARATMTLARVSLFRPEICFT
mmetsp:Transcript_38943/g.117135  ORF Transcript_38943/g.117135 Transcript_38943/m.117135 type:complete len:248 (+) Transcript_38943:100-843(+)